MDDDLVGLWPPPEDPKGDPGEGRPLRARLRRVAAIGSAALAAVAAAGVLWHTLGPDGYGEAAFEQTPTTAQSAGPSAQLDPTLPPLSLATTPPFPSPTPVLPVLAVAPPGRPDRSGSSASSPPTSAPTPVPTQAPPPPTQAPTAAPTPSLPPPPTPTPTPAPTPTPTATPTPTPTSTPAPTPTPSPASSPTPKPTPRPTPVPTVSPRPLQPPCVRTAGRC